MTYFREMDREFAEDLRPGLRYHRRRAAIQLRAGYQLHLTEYAHITRTAWVPTLGPLIEAEARIRKSQGSIQ